MTHEDATAALPHATNWRKTSASKENGGCVEVGSTLDMVEIRDTKPGPASPTLTFTKRQWEAFLHTTKTGRKTPATPTTPLMPNVDKTPSLTLGQ